MMKKHYAYRLCAFALAFIIILSTLTLTALAEGNSIVSVSRDRFLTDAIYVSDGTGTVDADGNVVMSFDGSAPSVSMNISSEYISKKNNSLRIVIDNASLCETMIVEYMYKNEADVFETRTKECAIVKGNGVKEYIIPVNNPRDITSLKLSFAGIASGTVTLVSIGSISYHEDSREYVGELAKSEYDPSESKAVIQGSVSWDCVSKNPGAKIVVYKLSQDQTAESIKDTQSFIASSDISLNYNISISIKKTMDAYSQYFVAVLTKDGEVLPIAPEFYLNVKRTPSQVVGTVGFKGIETSMYGGAIEGESSVAYVDIDIGQLFSYDENGFQYIVDGVEYYVNKNYVSQIDAVVNAYNTDDVDFYFRLLIDENCQGELFGSKDANGNARYYAVDIYDEKAFSKFIIYTEYMISRYGNMSHMRGVVLGRSLDVSNVYNYSSEPLAMNEYSKRIAKICVTLRNILDKYGSGREIILPFSDGEFGVHQIMPPSFAGGSYPVDLLASSTMKYLDGYNMNLDGLYFMMEGDSSPIKDENGADFDTPENSERSVTVTSVYEAIESCRAFEALLSSLRGEFQGLPDKFIYCWYAGKDSVANNYIYNYNVAVSFGGIRSFVVSFSDLADAEKESLSDFKTTYKYADTDKNKDVGADAISRLGSDSWESLIQGYASEKAVKRNFTKADIRNTVPNVIIGSYKMWDFENRSNTVGWSALYCCKEISISGASQSHTRALMLTISRENAEEIGAEYGSAIYSHENLLKVSGISGISFDVFIPKSDQEKIYELLITVESENESVEFSGVVFSGSDAILYADIENVDTVKSIKLSARELSSSEDATYSVYLRNISIHSSEYNDEDLEKIVVSGGIIDGNEQSGNASEELAQAIALAIVVASIILVWGIWLVCKLTQKI